MRFVPKHPALVVNDFLVITDLHVGVERSLEDKGYSFPSRTKKLYEAITFLMRKNKCEKLLILGDVKERVPGTSFQERAEVPWLLNKLSNDFEVVIVKGNHDAGLEKITDVRVVKEFCIGDTGFFHGHAWPSKELVEKSRVLVMGHVHPLTVFRDALGVVHQNRCWIVARLSEKKMFKRYGKNVDKLVVMPAFNPLLSGVHEVSKALTSLVVNEERFLLDLTKVV